MTAWHVLVDRDDFRRTSRVDATPGPLGDGEVRLAVDAFGLTANNVTYAAAGDMISDGADPVHRAELEDEQMPYLPLFSTSFVIDDFLADHQMFGAGTVVLGSASSKTAFGVAHLLARRDAVRVVGLTSPGNVEFVSSLGPRSGRGPSDPRPRPRPPSDLTAPDGPYTAPLRW